MSAITNFWAKGGAELRARFERTREAQTDSHIKGGANERAAAQFLRENVGVQRIALSSSIIDAHGNQSDEVDVAVVNQYQPLWTGDSEQILIAEGVDAAYQIKARLSTEELRRAIKNAKSVKQLRRTPVRARRSSRIPLTSHDSLIGFRTLSSPTHRTSLPTPPSSC